MDDAHGTERVPVYHDPERRAMMAELWPGGPPRLFALVQEDEHEDEHEDDRTVREVMAYGIELPDGAAATVGVAMPGWGRWLSADSASRRMNSDLVWLSQ